MGAGAGLVGMLVALLTSIPVASADPDATLQHLAELTDADWTLRRAAAERLAQVDDPDRRTVDAVRAALGDVDSRVRRAAAETLGAFGGNADRAAPDLVRRLDDDDESVVQAAARALGRIGRDAPGASEALEGLLVRPSTETRLAAAEALARFGAAPGATRRALTALLADPDADVRRAASDAIGLLRKPPEGASAALVAQLADNDAAVRTAAASALGRIGEPAVAPLIAALSTSENPLHLQAMVDAFARIGETAVSALIDALRDPARPLLARQYAAKALARVDDRSGRTVQALEKRLHDDSPAVRIAAIEALGNLGTRAAAATDDLVAIIDDRDEDVLVREYAISAAPRTAPASEPLKQRLVESVADTDPRISQAAVAALVAMSARRADGAGVATAIDDLRSSDPDRRLAGAHALAAAGPYGHEAVPFLADVVQSPSADAALRTASAQALGMIGAAAEPALPALNTALRSTDAALSSAALLAIQRIGPPTRSIPALMAAMKDSDLEVRGSAATAVRNFALARLDGWKALLRQSDAPAMRAWVARHEALYGITATVEERPGSRHPQASTDYFDVLGGRAAIRESVQLQTLALLPGEGDAARPKAIEDVASIEVPSHPFAKLLSESERAPERLPIADVVPHDRLFVWFRDASALRDVVDGGGDLFLRLESAFSLKAFDYALASRYLARLGLGTSNLTALEGLDAIEEIAVVVPDLFFIDGTDVTIIARLRQTGPIAELFALAQTDDPSIHTLHPKGLPDDTQVHFARRGDLLLVSTNLAELEHVLAAHDKPSEMSLGQSAEFRYMLQQLPLETRTRAYVYASDPFLRRLIGPRMKIAQMRRAQARADLDTLTAGALLFQLDGNTAAATTARLVSLGYAPERFASAGYSIDEHLVARSAQYGTAAAPEPLQPDAITDVSEAEAAAYAEYRTNYAAYWEQFFDPIAVRLDEIGAGEWDMTTFILPLLDSPLYDTVRETITLAESGLRLHVPQLAPAPVTMLSINLSDSARIELNEWLAGLLGAFTTVDTAIFDALTPTLHLAVQDSTPIVAVGSGDILGAFSEKLLQLQGFEPFLPIALSLLSQPASIYIELADPAAVLGFLRGATSARTSTAEGAGAFHQIKGEDTWIYTVDVLGMVSLHVRIAVEDGYLVVSNLPWSDKSRVTGRTEIPLNGARVALDLDAMSLQLPTLHTRSYADYRVAAVDGMGCLFPLLVSGAADTIDRAIARHLELFGFAPMHPLGGTWTWEDGSIASTLFGTAEHPVQPAYVPGDRNFGLFPTLGAIEASAQLEAEGLRTRVRWRSAARRD
jgi:HEAT repeat protein